MPALNPAAEKKAAGRSPIKPAKARPVRTPRPTTTAARPSQEKGPGEIGDTPGKDAESKQPNGGESKQKSASGQKTGEKQPGDEGEGTKPIERQFPRRRADAESARGRHGRQ